MPSRSKDNKGLAKGKHKRHQEFDHKIAWNKVNHGAPKRKRSNDWVLKIIANKQDVKV
jgi:hypothetical protein